MNAQHFHMDGTMAAVDQMVVSLTQAASAVLSDGDVLRFELATSEVLTNIVKHALNGGNEGSIVDIELSTSDDGVVLEIYDPVDTEPFNPRDVQTHIDDVDPLAESGRGIAIILSCADELNYSPINGRQRLSISFWKEGRQDDQN